MKVEYPFKITGDIFKFYQHFGNNVVKSNLLYDGTLNKTPLISVVIPAYNCELIHYAIDSALGQDFDYSFEIVVVDNNGINNNHVLDYIKSHDQHKIRYFRNQENIGLYPNWNRCVELARGEYVVFLHADDRLSRETLKNLWNCHLSIPQDSGIIGRFNVIDKYGNIVRGYSDKHKNSNSNYKIGKFGLLYDDLCTGCGALLKRNCIIDLGGWNPDLYPASDRMLLIKYMQTFGLYRLNYVVREETTYISAGVTDKNIYPSACYYMSKAIVKENFVLKWFWMIYVNCNYISTKNNTGIENFSGLNRIINLLTRYICKIYRLPYFRGRRNGF